MDKDKIFFGEQGLTTTSANYEANLAKETYQALEKELEFVKFYTTEVSLLGSPNKDTLRQGVDSSFLDNVEKKLFKIAQLKSLIAWLREAIKAKDRLIKEAQSLSTKEVCAIIGIDLPEEPSRYPRLNSDDVVASWNIKQRNRYYYLDTVCSVIGSYIHPSGRFSEERKALSQVLFERHTVSGSGRDTVLYTKTPTVSIEQVENTFFTLQNKYREFQAELNSLKHSIEVTLQEDDREKSLKEKDEYNSYVTEFNKVKDNATIHQKAMIAEAQALKIIIPDSLKDIYSKISQSGKK